jgi:hypothetical protein
LKESFNDLEFSRLKEKYLERAKYLVERGYVQNNTKIEDLAKNIYSMDKINESKNTNR